MLVYLQRHTLPAFLYKVSLGYVTQNRDALIVGTRASSDKEAIAHSHDIASVEGCGCLHDDQLKELGELWYHCFAFTASCGGAWARDESEAIDAHGYIFDVATVWVVFTAFEHDDGGDELTDELYVPSMLAACGFRIDVDLCLP